MNTTLLYHQIAVEICSGDKGIFCTLQNFWSHINDEYYNDDDNNDNDNMKVTRTMMSTMSTTMTTTITLSTTKTTTERR